MFVGSVRIPLLLALLAAGLMALASPAAAHDGEGDEAQRKGLEPVLQGTGLPAAGGAALTSFACEDGTAGPYPCQNVDLESFVPLPALGLGNGNDIWGWTDPDTGREYALMGTSTSTGFVDVTDPKDPVLVGQLPSESLADVFLLWRDIKVDGNFAFVVSEMSGHGMQVFDLTRLRDAGSTPKVFDADATYHEFSWAHNIAINTETDTAYVVGSNTCRNDEEHGGLHMIDISEPLNPRFQGCAVVDDDDGNEDTESNNYAHDVECVVYRGPDADYQGREICFGSNEAVVTIYDVTDKSNPQVISQTGYPTVGYTHQGSLTPDQGTFLFGDELDELDGNVETTTTYIMDASDLDAPGAPKPYAHDTTAIDHNLYIHGDKVYESNYAAGLRILEYDDASLAAGELREVGFFDIVPGADPTEFLGTWSNFRFGSGTTVVSSIENQVSGLFVLRPRLGETTATTGATAPGKSAGHRHDGRGRSGEHGPPEGVGEPRSG